MGLFDAFKGDAKLSKEEAAFGLLFIAVAADGEIDADEQRAFLSMLTRIRYFGRLDFDSAIRKISRCVREQGVEGFVAGASEGLESHIRKPLFLNFLDLLIADGAIGPEEERLANIVVDKLGLDSAYVKTAIAIIAEKNAI